MKQLLFLGLILSALFIQACNVIYLGAYQYSTPPDTGGIDIKPGSYPNSVNLKSQGLLPIAILSGEYDVYDVSEDPPQYVETITLDAVNDVDVSNVAISGSPNGIPVAMRGGEYVISEEDVDLDGDMDLVLHFETNQIDPGLLIQVDADLYEVEIGGVTTTGYLFYGSSLISIVKYAN